MKLTPLQERPDGTFVPTGVLLFHASLIRRTGISEQAHGVSITLRDGTTYLVKEDLLQIIAQIKEDNQAVFLAPRIRSCA
jgi:hypothetical protein